MLVGAYRDRLPCRREPTTSLGAEGIRAPRRQLLMTFTDCIRPVLMPEGVSSLRRNALTGADLSRGRRHHGYGEAKTERLKLKRPTQRKGRASMAKTKR